MRWRTTGNWPGRWRSSANPTAQTLALRWKIVRAARFRRFVAIAPYASLSNVVLNICHEYAGWLPKWVVQSGLKKLPASCQTPAGEFDTTTVLRRKPVAALFLGRARRTKSRTAKDVETVLRAGGARKQILRGARCHPRVAHLLILRTSPRRVLSWLGRGKMIVSGPCPR